MLIYDKVRLTIRKNKAYHNNNTIFRFLNPIKSAAKFIGDASNPLGEQESDFYNIKTNEIITHRSDFGYRNKGGYNFSSKPDQLKGLV